MIGRMSDAQMTALQETGTVQVHFCSLASVVDAVQQLGMDPGSVSVQGYIQLEEPKRRADGLRTDLDEFGRHYADGVCAKPACGLDHGSRSWSAERREWTLR